MPHQRSAGAVILRILGSFDVRAADGRELSALVRQPKGVALLVYVALARGLVRRRDVLLAHLWPELDDKHARNALSQTLHRLRGTLGDGVLLNRGDQEVSLAAGRITCDVVEFRELIAAGKLVEALARFRGDLMEGFYIRGAAPEFDEWLEGERLELRRAAVTAAWTLAEAEAAAGNAASSAHWGRRALALSPTDEAGLRRLLQLLDDAGDRTGALQIHDEFTRALRTAYDLEPDAETSALIERIRAPRPLPVQAPAPTDVLPAAALAPAPVPLATAIAVPRPRSHWRRRVRWPLALAACGLLVLTLVRAQVAEPPRILAVGWIDVPETLDSAGSLSFLLTTALARAPELSVVTDERLREVLTSMQSEGRSFVDMQQAARAAGATEVLEGVITKRPRGGLRLDLRRVDIASGNIRAGYTAEANQVLDLIDLAGERIADNLGVRVPSNRLGATTMSLAAYHIYDQGLRTYYAGEKRGAARLFEAALAEDSTFAMAAYYAARAHEWPEMWKYMQRAVQLSQHASERERLLIATAWAMMMQEPARLRLAQSLAERFPTDPDGALIYGNALIWGGEFLAAVPILWRAVRLDSISLSGVVPRCLACDAFESLRMAYTLADSLPAAERVMRAWIQRQPTSNRAWSNLTATLEYAGRYDEALAALRTATAYRPTGVPWPGDATGIWIRQGRFDQVDAAWREALETGEPGGRLSALWGQTISFRTQGRLDDALRSATAYRRLSTETATEPHQNIMAAGPEAIVRLEMGDARASAALFESIAGISMSPSPARDARSRAWNLTHAATAYASLRDTSRLRELEDTIRVYGARSAYARDQRLHHYVRGLRHRIAGRHREAEAAFRQALFSPIEGYVRVNLELARTLIDLERPHEAIHYLRAALTGPVSATGLYATRTELQELMAEALVATGQPDSAAVYAQQAARAWSKADPSFHSRRARLHERGG